MWVVKEGLRETLVFGQSPERAKKRMSHVNTCRLRIPGKGHSRCKGPEVGTCLREGSRRATEKVRQVWGTGLVAHTWDL